MEDSRPHRRRWWRWFAALAVVGCVGIAAYDTLREPVLRTATVILPGLPDDAPPLRVVFLSDLHVAGPITPPERIARLVERINALHPDMVLLGGDYLGNVWPQTRTYSYDEALAPLAGLRSRYGTIAVLGNHEHPEVVMETPPATLDEPETPGGRALRKLGIPVLINQAMRVGPVTIAGRDIAGAGRWGVWQLQQDMHRLGPPYVGLGHAPRTWMSMPMEIPVGLVGHTHCGQLRVPLLSQIWMGWWQPLRYACGLHEEGGRTLITTAGIGESRVPVRFLAPPEFWLVTLVPAPGWAKPPPDALP